MIFLFAITPLHSGGLGCVAPLGTKIFPAPYATVIERPWGDFFELFSETAIYLGQGHTSVEKAWRFFNVRLFP